MKRIIFALLFCSQSVFGQVNQYQKDFNQINENLMLGLGSYAVTNFVLSGYGYTRSSEEASKRFHEMNVLWNTVNFSLALPGYLKAKNGGKVLSLEEMVQQQKKTEAIFLINDVLDLGYIATGIWMQQSAERQIGREDLFRGYGTSLILQGSFLIAFDTYAYLLHHGHAKKSAVLQRISYRTTSYGVGFSMALD